MYRRPQRPRTLIEAVAVYAVMTLAVVSIATFIIFFVMGFRFNADDGRIEQYAFLQFASSPSGATVTVDGKVVGSKTPNKDSVKPGTHDIVMWR
ncbi:PEGA domain-containing protein, partial [Candidatus Saccharibacteria bacterium]|nr:PEGA domain-containing protein [Candidatus Saccharibacteria bacterium]